MRARRFFARAVGCGLTVVAFGVAAVPELSGQDPLFAQAPADTLGLVELQDAAVARDPRLARRALERRSTELRLENLDAEHLPSFRLTGDASYQSEVTEIPIDQPGVQVGVPPKDRYEGSLDATWLLWDGGRLATRGDVERARRDAALATVDAELYELRGAVSDAFFGALLAQERLREAGVLVEDLEARLDEVRAGVAAGAALPGDTAVVRAELLLAGQRVDALDAERRTAMAVLEHLTGRRVGPGDVLVLPDFDAALADAPEVWTRPESGGGETVPSAARLHPRYGVFAAERARLEREVEAVHSDRRPRVSAFGQLAYGSPGFSQFDDELHEYWRAGLQMEWRPWAWSTRDRELQILDLRRRLVDTEEEAFTDELLRAVQVPLRAMERARAALATDDEIVALREQVERQARAQLAERAISPSRYTDARTDLTEARVARVRHRVELARAQADYLLILGAELR